MLWFLEWSKMPLAGVLQIAFERVAHIGYVDAFESDNAGHNPGQWAPHP